MPDRWLDDPSSLQAWGCTSRNKVLLLRADEQSIYGKLQEEGVVAVRTKQAICLHIILGVEPGSATAVEVGGRD